MSNYENIINEHFFEVISNFGNNIKSPEHDFLYHYTPQTTLIKILDEKKLHLSHVSYLNDPDEIKFGLKVILKILKNSIKNNSYSINKISEILETNDNFEKIIFQKLFFVFSLSVEPDLLSQWRAYADGGNGISIGFVRQNLINSVARHLNNNNNIPFFIPISYYSNKCISSQVIIPKFEKHINLFFKYFDDIVVENKVNKSIEYNESFKQIFTLSPYSISFGNTKGLISNGSHPNIPSLSILYLLTASE